MKRYFLLFLLLSGSGYAQTQNVTVTAAVPPAVNANASYHGAQGNAAIYYNVCAIYPAGSVCQFNAAVAAKTAGIASLGGSNSVTVSWSFAPGSTSYYVMRFSTPGAFTGFCTNCSIAGPITTTSITDSSPSTPSGSFPPAGVNPIQQASGQITLDNVDYQTPGLLWTVFGVEYPFGLLPPGFTPNGCIEATPNPPFLKVLTLPCGSGSGSGTVTSVGTGTGLTGGPITTTGTISCNTASSSVVGCVEVDGTTITATGGVISAAHTGTVTSVGTGAGLTGGPITGTGTISCNTISSSVEGCATVDGTTITATGGVISAANTGNLNFHGTPTANGLVTDYDSTHIQTPDSGSTLDTSGNLVASASVTSANVTSTGPLTVAGNAAVTGYVAAGAGGSGPSVYYFSDSGGDSFALESPNAIYNGSCTMPAAAPTTGQVLTATTGGTSCVQGWTTPASGPTTNQNLRQIGGVLTPSSLTACVFVAFAGTINAFHAIATDGASAATVVIKVETQPTFATWISTGVSGASDITSGGESLSAVLGKVDTTLTGWTTSLTAGTTVCFVASSFSGGTTVNANISVAAN